MAWAQASLSWRSSQAIPVSQSASKTMGPTGPDGNSEMPGVVVQKCDVSRLRNMIVGRDTMCGDSSNSRTPVFCIVEFVQGTRVEKERAFVPGLSVVQNGPPGTFVTFADGRRVPLPTDQIVFAEDNGGAALKASSCFRSRFTADAGGWADQHGILAPIPQ